MYFYLEQRDPVYTAYSGKGLSPLPHLHKHLEIILMKKGKSLAVVGSKNTFFEDGDLFISFPNQIHYYLDEPIPQEHWILIVSPDICPEFKHEFNHFLPVSPVLKGAADNPKIVFAFENMMESYASKNKYSETEVKGNMLILLSELFQCMPLEEKQTYDTNLLTDIIHYCYDNYMEDISLQSLANALHVSHYYISHIFNERLHISFRDYINSLRIGKACEMLKRNEQTITEIAFEVGYNSTRTFDRCFTKIEGVSPKEYRENMKSKSKGTAASGKKYR